METVENLTEEINILNDLSKDLSFDETVLADAKQLIGIKNNKIVELGGTAIIFTVKEEIGSSDQDLLNRITAQLKALYPFRTSEKVGAKYRTLDRVFKLKSGITFDEYKAKGSKFLYGGAISNYTNNVLSNLEKTNQFFLLRETDKDAILKYTTPENSILYSVVLPDTNVVYALAYPVDKATVVDFYKDEALTESLNLSFTFSPTFDESTFKNEYLLMMKQLADLEQKS